MMSKYKFFALGLMLLLVLGSSPLKAQEFSKELIDEIKTKAETGDAASQCDLGAIYYGGKGLKQSDSQAFKWYQKSAAQGYAAGEYNLGFCYENGIGVSKNYSEAFIWYKKAASQGLPEAEYQLGNCYAYGRGVAIDYDEAIKWLTAAADHGHKLAIEALKKLNLR